MIVDYIFFAISVLVGFAIGAFWGLYQPLVDQEELKQVALNEIEVIEIEVVYAAELSVGEAYIEAKRTGGKTGC